MAKKKKAPEAEKENGERWLVSYADFMTLLLGLFIILYSKAAADAGAAGSDGAHQASAIAALSEAFGGSPIAESNNTSIIDWGALSLESDIETRNLEEMKEEIDELAKELDDEIGKDLNIEDFIQADIDENGLHIRLTAGLLFASGSHRLTKEAEDIITEIGKILKKLPSNNILVEGHTDNDPISNSEISSNWELGALRATTVTELLIKKCAISAKSIAAVSYGEFHPLNMNLTKNDKAANRRVEITILRKSPITIDANNIN